MNEVCDLKTTPPCGHPSNVGEMQIDKRYDNKSRWTKSYSTKFSTKFCGLLPLLWRGA